MRTAVWKTGHKIADTVADAFGFGNPSVQVIPSDYTPKYIDEKRYEALDDLQIDAHIVYGILRHTIPDYARKRGKPFFIIDNGYFKPGHYDGYYRISLNGTQQTTHFPKPDYERWKQLGLEVKPWEYYDETLPELACPPSCHVREWDEAAAQWQAPPHAIIRTKDSGEFDGFHNYSHVHTYNSSMGWRAMLEGVNATASGGILAAWKGTREDLFATMAAMQFTLSEIREGKAWELIRSQLS